MSPLATFILHAPHSYRSVPTLGRICVQRTLVDYRISAECMDSWEMVSPGAANLVVDK